MHTDSATFNAGVFVVNLTQWRDEKEEIDKELHYWMTQVIYPTLL